MYAGGVVVKAAAKVKIAAEVEAAADVVYAHKVGYVVRMSGEQSYRRLLFVYEGAAYVHAYHAAALS